MSLDQSDNIHWGTDSIFDTYTCKNATTSTFKSTGAHSFANHSEQIPNVQTLLRNEFS